MTYQEWEAEVPSCVRNDPVWRVEVYRLGLFISDLVWNDSGSLLKDRRTCSIADQMFRAGGNISSNVCEGYSRSTGKDRARFFEYALGSAREVRDWYYKARRALRSKVVDHRMDLASQIVALLVAMIKSERRRARISTRLSPN